MSFVGFLSQLPTLQAQPATVIRGRVLDQAGKLATNVWVQAQTLDTNAPPDLRTGGWALAATNSDLNGEFALSVAALPATWALLALQGENVAWHEHSGRTEDLPAPTFITLELRPWPRINASIRALDDSPLGYGIEIEMESTAIRANPPVESAPVNVATGDELKPGLVAEMFIIPEWSPFDAAWFTRTPLFRRIDAQIDYPESDLRFGDTGLEDRFAVRWSGVLRVSKNGRYGLTAVIDDGVRVSIDGQEVLTDTRLLASRQVAKELQLSKGDHEFLVEYFEVSVGQVCVVSWIPPGGTIEVIPSSALFHARRHLRPATSGKATRKREPQPASTPNGDAKPKVAEDYPPIRKLQRRFTDTRAAASCSR